MRTILFICTGNTCRSPMAEAIAREAIERGATGNELFVASAGVAAPDGAPVTPEAIAALERLGIEHRGASKRLTAEMIRNADLVLGMTGAHVAAARQLVDGDPDAAARVQQLDPEGDIDDPIGLGQPVYDAVARRLRELMPRRLAEVLAT